MAIKNMIEGLVGITIGTEAMKSAGNMGSGLKEATQSFIGLGILGSVAKGSKSLFKWK